jgi:4-amino-4-deoxy-L-arabinose transferase-like glycosyltransferase
MTSPASNLSTIQPSSLPVRSHWPLFFVLVVFLIFATAYNVAVPLLEKPDEKWHYPYVQNIAAGKGLPVYGQGAWNQEGGQGPVYYALTAAATFWVDDGDFDILARWNPFYTPLADRPQNDNPNRFVHTDRETWPYHGATLALHLARQVSVLMGLVAVLGTYLIVWEIWSGRRALATGAAAVVAFNPMFLFIASAVSNDVTVAATASLAAWAALRLALRDAPLVRQAALAGLFLGLALLSKTSAVALGPVVGGALVYRAWRERNWRTLVAGGLTVAAVTLAVTGWWFVRSWRLYGDPLGMKVWLQHFGVRNPKPTLLDLLPEFDGLEMSYWAVFGWRDMMVGRWIYVLFLVADRLALAGWLVGLVRAIRRRWRGRSIPPGSIVGLGLVWLWLGAAFAALLRYMQLIWANHGRLLFPAAAAVGVVLFVGWRLWLPRRATPWLTVLVGSGLAVLSILCLWGYIVPAYAPPPRLTEAQIEAIPHRLDVEFGGVARLLGYDLADDVVRPGDVMEVTLYWRAIAGAEQDYAVFVHLLDEHDLVVAQKDTHPGLGRFPASRWQVGDTFADTYRLQVPETAYAPSAGPLEVGFYLPESGQRLPTTEGVDNARFGSVAVQPREGLLPNPTYLNFGDKIALVGYNFDRRTVAPGDTLRLTLYWESLVSMEESYTVFVHVLGKEMQMWAIGDGVPVNKLSPTFTWQPGRIVQDPRALTLDQNTPPGVYDVEVGLYLSQTGGRLRLLADDGFPLDTRVFLSKIRVNP